MKQAGQRKTRHVLLAALLVLLAPVQWSSAHSPHHVITDIATAPTGAGSADVFILIMDQIMRSDGSGASWKNLVHGLNTQYVFTSVAVSPAYAADHTVFLSTSGDGVYRSLDGGETWKPINAGLGHLDISSLSIVADGAGDFSVLAASASGGA